MNLIQRRHNGSPHQVSILQLLCRLALPRHTDIDRLCPFAGGSIIKYLHIGFWHCWLFFLLTVEKENIFSSLDSLLVKMDGTKAITLKEKLWRSTCLTEEQLREPGSWIPMVLQPTPSPISGLHKDVLGASLVAAQTGYQDMDKRLRDLCFSGFMLWLVRPSDFFTHHPDFEKWLLPLLWRGQENFNSRIFVLTMPKFCWHLLRSLHIILWDVVQLKNHLPQTRHISRNGKHICVRWELGKKWGVTAKRDRVSIGREGSKILWDLVGLSVTLVTIASLRQTLFHMQTGGSCESQLWVLRS